MKILAALRKLIACPERLVLSIAEGSRRVSHLAFVAILLTFLFSLFTFTLTHPALAAAPTPLPCQNPTPPDDEILTDNWLVDENKNPPQQLQLTAYRYGTYGEEVDVTATATFTVDFSTLSAIFGPQNSNYLEGKFQDPEHKSANVIGLSPSDFSKFNGPGQKAVPRAVLDELRTKYVQYVNANPTLAESGDTFTDFEGKNPKTIHDLVEAFGDPVPPSMGTNKDTWQEGWGKYWSKIPISYSEFYEAYINFRAQHKAGFNRIVDPDSEENGDYISMVLRGALCPYPLDRTITFVMPEFFRTTAVSGQLNQIIVPKEAQSCNSNNLILGNTQNCQPKNLISKIIDTCLRAFTNNPVSNALKKVVKISLNLLSPQAALAAEDFPERDTNCIRAYKEGKEGQAPYCALPAGQGESCTNQQDSFKLDKDNPNVICDFTITWSRQDMKLEVGEGENQFDWCSDTSGEVTCTVTVYIWPIFRIPFQTEIWNNTLYSDTDQNEPFIGSPGFQREGQPGVYSFFKPRAIFEDELEAAIRKCTLDKFDTGSQACQFVVDYVSANIPQGQKSSLESCVGANLITNPERTIECITNIAQHLEKKRPGKVAGAQISDVNRRFIGGTDCAKEFVWHNALYPRAAQQQFGITNECPLTAVAQLPDQGPGPGTGPPPSVECDATGIEFNGEDWDIQNYVACYATGKTINVDGQDLDLATVMLGTMGYESGGGDSCAVGNADEIGVFQFMSGTWSGSSAAQAVRTGNYVGEEGSVARDSGSANFGVPHYPDGSHARGVCWENPGSDNPSYASDPNMGPNIDDGAWNPYLQVRLTHDMMLDPTPGARGACNWSGFAAYMVFTRGTDPCGIFI